MSICQDVEDTENLEEVDLLTHMDIEDVAALRLYFFPKDRAVPQPGGLSLSRSEFIEAMQNVAHSSAFAECAGKLYDTLDIDRSGTLQWEEVLDAIIQRAETLKEDREPLPVIKKLNIYNITHANEETIVKILALETASTFCYAIVSKSGRVGIYDGVFNLISSYKIGLKLNPSGLNGLDFSKETRSRRLNTWVTDAVFVPETFSLLVASSNRVLSLYDATGIVHVPLCQIIGLPEVPTCLSYCRIKTGNSQLFIGDDKGTITIMTFHQAENSLFKKKHPDKLDKYFWTELLSQPEYVTHTTLKKIHSGVVKQIIFSAESKTILSCSFDVERTLVVQQTDKKRDPYIFKLPGGVRCFDEDRALHIIVTGSNDNLIRIWNPVVTNQPITALVGHKKPIVDVRIYRPQNLIISLDESAVLKLWHVQDEFCLLTSFINFPAFQELGRQIEYGCQSIYPGPQFMSSTNHKNVFKTSLSELGQLETLNFGVSNDDQEWWRQFTIVISCCNYVAALTFSPSEESEQDVQQTIKPPPTNENISNIEWRKVERQSTTRSTEGSLKSISTESSFVAGNKLLGQGMHTKKTEYHIKQEKMKMLIQQNAPHLALDLYELDVITFNHPLPDTKAMREKGIDISTPEQLLKTRICRNSAGNLSVLECESVAKSNQKLTCKTSPVLQKQGNISGGRATTPDWFVRKTNTVRPISF